MIFLGPSDHIYLLFDVLLQKSNASMATVLELDRVIGYTITAIHNGPLAIIEPAHMVVYFSCHRLSLILLIIIACYFYLNDEGLICSLYQSVMENLKIWIFKKFILLQPINFLIYLCENHVVL